jgi:hypothetical protein
MRSTVFFAVALLFVVALVSVPYVGAQSAVTGDSQVVGSPDIDVSVTDNRLGTGEVEELTVTLSNSGDIRRGGPQVFQERVKTARNVRVSIDEEELDAPIDVKTGTVVLGDVADGQPRTATFRVETEEDAEPGRYSVPIRVEYVSTLLVDYLKTSTPPGYTSPSYRGENEETVMKEAEVVFESEPRFDVVSESASGLYAGDTGNFEVTVRNTGDETARDATVRFESGSTNLGFGSLSNPRNSATVSAGGAGGDVEVVDGEVEAVAGEGSDIAPGESATVSVKMNAVSEATPGFYPVSVSVEYLNQNGVEEVSDSIRTQVQVGEERRFSIEDLQTESLRVDENDAVVTGNVVNTGAATARNVVVTVSSEGSITATGSQSAVGDLEPEESKPVRFTVAVAEDAEPGSRSLTFNVEYENDEGDLRTADEPVRKPVSVGEELDSFEVVGVDTSVSAGGGDTVEVEIRNNGENNVSAVNAKMFVNDPLSSSDNSAFLDDMEPGETKTAVFRVSATGDAVPKEYDASLELRYEDRTGETELTDGISFGVPVAESSGGLPIPFVVAGLVVVAASGGIFVYRRRMS